MKRIRACLGAQLGTLVVVAVCLGVLIQPTVAGAEGVLTVRRALGVAFIGGSAVMVKQALDFRDEADDFYARYKAATEADEIDRLYQRTNNRDIKSQLSWALAAAFAVSGLRLVLSPGPDRTYQRTAEREPMLTTHGLALESQVQPGRIGLHLKRRFF